MGSLLYPQYRDKRPRPLEGTARFSDKNRWQGNFPGGAVVKNLPANAGDMGSIPGLGRSHMPRSN